MEILRHEIIQGIEDLPEEALTEILKLIGNFKKDIKAISFGSNLLNEVAIAWFGRRLVSHHSRSAEPLSKDRFEHLLQEVLTVSGTEASLAPKGNPGFDILVNGQRISLKTQANKSISDEKIWISKWMELGKGDWTSKPGQLRGLLNRFLTHLDGYDRVLVLRAFTDESSWRYELLEIPVSLMRRAIKGSLLMMLDSKQMPKPGYCTVTGKKGEVLYKLYFDGGSERKLQVKDLAVTACVKHAEWIF